MNYLPPPDEQAWLLEKLKELIRHRGRRTFLQAPLLEATDEYFPDRWTPNDAGVRRLLRRILRYAGIGQHPVTLDISDEDSMPVFGSDGRVHGYEHANGSAAWFNGIDDDGTLHFGVTLDRVEDPRSLAAILCHEVAHAYRARHGLEYPTNDEEESLTDLTTVYLGFGVLTANLAHWRTSKAHPEYLTPQAFAFLLGAQVVCRGLGESERRKIAKQLQANQAAFFEAACVELEKRNAGTLLGVGTSMRAKQEATARAFNRGLPVYRIRAGWFRRARCSDDACRSVLSKTEEVCPGCMGTIMGEVATPAEAVLRERQLVEAETQAADDVLAILKRDDRDR